jgi:hypothetical protein
VTRRFARPRAEREPRRPPAPAKPLTQCPRCSAPLTPDQDWCLQCGLAARTRLAPTPDWRLPLVAAIVAALLGAGGLAFAFVKLTSDDGPVTTTTTPAATTTTPAATTTTTTTTATTTAPSTTATETTGGTGAEP